MGYCAQAVITSYSLGVWWKKRSLELDCTFTLGRIFSMKEVQYPGPVTEAMRLSQVVVHKHHTAIMKRSEEVLQDIGTELREDIFHRIVHFIQNRSPFYEVEEFKSTYKV
jgi:hypothetical protein